VGTPGPRRAAGRRLAGAERRGAGRLDELRRAAVREPLAERVLDRGRVGVRVAMHAA